MSDLQTQFSKVIDHFSQELNSIRTGRATPDLVDRIQVEAYGVKQELKTLASISTPDSKTVQIEPWDASVVKGIEKALIEAELGMSPNVDGKTIRLNMPMMTDENRQQMVKRVKEKAEEARIAVRKVREEQKKRIEKQEGISDDDKHAELKDLEEQVKEQNQKIEEIGKKKEQEITTI